MNIVEHGIETGADCWLKLEIGRVKERLSISITDKGMPFDPRGEAAFDIDEYVSSGRRRGLGLIMTRNLIEGLKYRSDRGINKIFFEKTSLNADDCNDSVKEEKMREFIFTEPRRLSNGDYLISLKGDLDAKGALIMEDLLDDLLEKEIHNIVLDFAEVKFISSAGVGILIGVGSSMRESGGEAKITNVNQNVRSVLSLLNLDDFFNTVDIESIV
jgi:anti-sigma B factor antagonist